MLKIFFSLAFIFFIVYCIYCGVVTLTTRSDEDQVAFMENFFKGLHGWAICFTITAGIVSFIVINF